MKTLTRQTLKIFWRHAKRYPWKMALIVFSVIGFTSASIYTPLWYKKLFDLLATGDTSRADELIRIILVILAINGLVWLFYRFAEFTTNYFQPQVMKDIKNTCYQYLQRHSYNFFNNNFTGSLVRRVNRYARAFETIADQFHWQLGNVITRVVVIIIILFFVHRPLAFIVIAWSIIYTAFHFWFSKTKLLKLDTARAEADSATSAHLADTITNSLNIKLFSGFRKEFATYKGKTEEFRVLQKKSWDLRAVADAVQVALMMLLEFIVFYVAIRMWQNGEATVGDFALIQAYIIQMFNHLWGLGHNIRRIYESLAEAEEMTEILMTPHDVQDVSRAKNLLVSKGEITYDAVGFEYNENIRIFDDFNLTIAAGERIALVGPSGGGKSTLMKLLFRFYDVQKGSISIDGQDIAEVKQDSLREQIAFVPQEPILFHRSLLENIQYGNPNATKDDAIKAAKLAHCHEFISNLPEGYDTFVGERGVKLSGGERQRVAIARAILKDAPLLVLDEATSSLDSESEHLIQAALKNLMKKRTTIVIAHRLSTIMQMDRILVLQGGKIIEEGTHQELLNLKKGTYQKLWEIQAGGFDRN